MYRFKMTTFIRLLIILFAMSMTCVGNSYATTLIEGIQIYKKNLHSSPEHRQKLADDITRYRNADNLWDVLRDEFALPHYENNPAVQEKVEWFMNNQDFLLHAASRAAPYLYYISQQVKKRHLPAELVLLPIIESGYNPFSTSNVGAAGIWQLMPLTAAGLGLRREWGYDARRDVIASTRAALTHLAYLENFFDGNWLLALAAYDTGEGNVMSAIRRNIRSGTDTDFWSLPVAQETKNYVPSLLALAVIISNPDRYPIYFPPVRNAPYLAQIDVGTKVNLHYAAQLAGISYIKMTQLNPGFSQKGRIKNPTKLILPIENVEQFTENFSQSPFNHEIDWIHYRMKPGDTLASVAKKFGTTTVAIRKLNHINRSILRHGTNLLIPRDADEQILASTETMPSMKATYPVNKTNENGGISKSSRRTAEMLAAAFNENPSGKYTIQSGDTVYMVRSTDTIDKIAKHFHVNINAIRTANGLNGKKSLRPGVQVIIPTHTRNTSVASTRPNTMTMPQKQIMPGNTLYMIRHGDTIEKIASKYHTTPSAIRIANLMADNSLKEGEGIVVPTHIRG